MQLLFQSLLSSLSPVDPVDGNTMVPMERQGYDGVGDDITKSGAVAACTAMAVFYVAILYSPTLILRLPQPTSFKSFMVRRFVCAAVSSIVCLGFCSLILPIRKWNASLLFGVYGIRPDHIWQALIYPISLTSCMYMGSFVRNLFSVLEARNKYLDVGGNPALFCKNFLQRFINQAASIVSSISSWRNYFVAPLTEELVFRACMIPLLLCGGFSTYVVIFLCPTFFSLAHLNHLLEFYVREDYTFLKACSVVGFQLGYTVIFGAYASFLLIRTGHLSAPLIAHIFCNFMGLPAMFSRTSGMVSVAFVVGMLGFLWLLFPLTNPLLYNNITEDCKCWHRYCTWS
ncbi:CAAX prenyl protease 2 [Primulina huaijiensis]|uniref:CAAX prenyl protease 2 n=1 Tax=Primulina huaijiensis TaxID=1492673 RepID=UPI003CC77C83